MSQIRVSPDTDLHRWSEMYPCTSVSREASISAISGSDSPGRRLTTEHTERPTTVTEHTEVL